VDFKARYAKWRVLRERQWCPGCLQYTGQAAGEMCLQCGQAVEQGDPVYHKTPGGERIPDGVRDDREDELMARIAPHVLRVSQEDLDRETGLVETPPQLRTTKLRPDTRRVYDDLERHMIAHVRTGVVTAANAMVAVTRLAQVTSGYGVDARTGQPITLGDQPEKALLLADELADLDPAEPVVIFARFHHDLDQIQRVCETQGRRYGEISGRRTDGLHGHRMSADIDVVGVQPQAGGAGISLTRARICVFYTSDWSLAGYQQGKRRVLRQGQTRHVTYLHLVAEDTIDVSLFYALRRRKDVVDAILSRLGGTQP
jgi:SNF2 family DNA or RNA helicase